MRCNSVMPRQTMHINYMILITESSLALGFLSVGHRLVAKCITVLQNGSYDGEDSYFL